MAVLTELLLRGSQTAGELRTRASRMEAFASLDELHPVLDSLIEKGLALPVSPAGRGQLFSHTVYPDYELERIKAEAADMGKRRPGTAPANASVASSQPASSPDAIQALREEVAQLRSEVDDLKARFEQLLS